MAEIIQQINGINFLINTDKQRAFLPSNNINIFPCSRRGQLTTNEDVKYFDPEARLNTERTNRLHTAINGFTDKFIINDNFTSGDTLVFVLAGYRIEVKNCRPEDIATALDANDADVVYAHLSLHGGVSLNVDNYYTEILYRQSTSGNNTNSLDVSYEYTDAETIKYNDDFFVGVSFTLDQNTSNDGVTPYHLPLFFKADGNWKLVQTSLLPKVEHDTEPDSIKLSGDFTVNHDEQTSFKVTKNKTILGPTEASELTASKLKLRHYAPSLNGYFNHVEIDSTASKFYTPVTVGGDLTVHGSGTTTMALSTNEITGRGSDTVTMKANLNAENISAKSLFVPHIGRFNSEVLDIMGPVAISGDLGTASDCEIRTDRLKADELFLKVDNVDGGYCQVPALKLVSDETGSKYRLHFKFKKP